MNRAQLIASLIRLNYCDPIMRMPEAIPALWFVQHLCTQSTDRLRAELDEILYWQQNPPEPPIIL